MYQNDHELAAFGTMSWPELITMRPVRVGFFCPGPSIATINWPELRVWEASSGQNCEPPTQRGRTTTFDFASSSSRTRCRELWFSVTVTKTGSARAGTIR